MGICYVTRMIKAVFFDFDGVLTLDATGTTSIVKYISARTGIDKELFNTEYRRFNKDLLLGVTTHDKIWGKLCYALNQEIPEQVLIDSFLNTPLDHKMFTLARELKSLGYKVGMITDNKADRIKAISDANSFDELFDVVSVSASVGLSKSGKEIFWDAIRKIGVDAEESLFIDNNPKNLVVPVELGMSIIQFDHDERDYDRLFDQLRREGVL